MKIVLLVWDRQNLDHIAQHNVEKEEVEELIGRRHEIRTIWKGRYALRGQSAEGRYLFVVLDAMGQGYAYVVTARDMTDHEKTLFRRTL